MKNTYLTYEKWIVCGIAVLLLGGILFGTGTIFSGWHLVDDHETVRIFELSRNKGISWVQAYRNFMHFDIRQRWRPLYGILRIWEAYLFGWNSVIPNILLCVQGMITYVLLYWTARHFTCNVVFSHMFSMTVILGRQFEIWYRIANQENVGLLLLAVVLYMLARQYRYKQYDNHIYDAVCILAGILCSCMKESFVLLLPAFVFLRIGLEWIAIENQSFIHIIKKNVMGITWWSVTLITHLSIILFYVGTTSANLGHAGVDLDMGIKYYIWKMLGLCKGALRIYVILAVVLCIAAGVFLIVDKRKTENKKMFFLVTTTGIYIMLTQMFLHVKSDMWDRYLIPAVAGFALTFIIGISMTVRQFKQRIIIYTAIIIFLISRLIMAVGHMSMWYAKEGFATQKMFTLIKQNADTEDTIIAEMGSEEENLAICTFMDLQGRSKGYVFREDENQYVDGFGSEEVLENMEDVKVYVTNPNAKKIYDLQNPEEWEFYDVENIYWIYIKSQDKVNL